jgi:uncharacterized repeat protein (TIGR03803 family)
MVQKLGKAILGVAWAGVSMLPVAAAASTVTTLYTFSGGSDGAYPIGGLVLGRGGSYFGTTDLGGAGCNGTGCGTIFQFTPPAAGQTKGTLKTIYTFDGGTDGQEPVNLIADKQGNLFGVAQYGGVSPVLCKVSGVALGCGTVFELSPPAAGQTAWTFATLYSFTGGADGSFPSYGLAQDASGALFGVAYSGGTCATANCGTVFELVPPAAGQSAWTEVTLHDFAGGADGSAPYGTPLLDASGNVYGTTTAGGFTKSAICTLAHGCGTVFKLTPPASGSTVWTKTTVWGFLGTDGLYPEGGLTKDGAGNLYGTTNLGGSTTACVPTNGTPPGCGTVYKLSPPAAGAKAWALTSLWTFAAGADGLYPAAGLTPRGTSFLATASGNGPQGYGALIQLTPPAAGATKWTEASLFTFTNNANGAQPIAAPLLRGGIAYGTTLGHDGPAPARYGTIYSVVP